MSPLIFTEHITGEDEYRICVNVRLHILFRENIVCNVFGLDGMLQTPPAAGLLYAPPLLYAPSGLLSPTFIGSPRRVGDH